MMHSVHRNANGHAHASSSQTDLRPRVSVIMRCKNSDWVIGQALTALFSQTFQDFELIVVDSGSQDRTLDIVKQFPCRLIEIEAAQYLPGAVLNMAAEEARGELLVFQNSDTVPLHQECLSRLVSAFDDGDVHASFARQVPRPEAHGWVRRDYAAAFPPQGEAPPWLTLSLPLAAMRKAAWKEHPFYVDAWASEDTEWGAWARESGRNVQYVPESTVMHSHNYTLRQIFGRRFVEGEADAFIYGSGGHPWSFVARTLQSIVRDWQFAMKEFDVRDALMSPVRRAVYHWAYCQGRRHGWNRIRTGDTNVAAGQQIILQRHDAAEPRQPTESSVG